MGVSYYILSGSTKNRGGAAQKIGVSYYIIGGSTKNRGGATEKRGVSYSILCAARIKTSASSYIIAGSREKSGVAHKKTYGSRCKSDAFTRCIDKNLIIFRVIMTQNRAFAQKTCATVATSHADCASHRASG